MEDLKELAWATKFLYSKELATELSQFILYYQKALFTAYQYKIILDKLSTDEMLAKSVEETQKLIKEPYHREKITQCV